MKRTLRFFRQNDSGAAIVEFAIILPMMLMFLGLSIEGARMFWAFQTTVAGVQDATRYLSRAMPSDSCSAGRSTDAWDEKLGEIVRASYTGATPFPKSVSITTVQSSLTCTTGTYRGGQVGVANVTATLQMTYPLSGLIELVGGAFPTISTSVTDSARVLSR
ncbi:TadE/TadG family type IV pilus assembly protein [Antarctobacter sp.]|uniref:TadE/TadG family type IV pilus assembly protein n=1 Tax=Antarctobacter sp. TaxID=1872577 RepID=UPI003A95DE73